jgi:hypothetical protein
MQRQRPTTTTANQRRSTSAIAASNSASTLADPYRRIKLTTLVCVHPFSAKFVVYLATGADRRSHDSLRARRVLSHDGEAQLGAEAAAQPPRVVDGQD